MMPGDALLGAHGASFGSFLASTFAALVFTLVDLAIPKH
jgi:hypothetical protein